MASLIVPLLAAVCLGLPVVATLLEEVPDRCEEPFATMPPETWNWQTTAFPVASSRFTGPEGQYGVHKIRLTTTAAARLLQHSELHFQVGSYKTEPRLDHATLAFEGTTCVYRTRPGATFPNNDLLILQRGPACEPLQGTPTGKLDLTVTLRNTARLALWTYYSRAPEVSTLIHPLIEVPMTSPGQSAVLGRGVTMLEGSSMRRVDLLAHVWQLRPGAAWIWWSVGLAIAGMAAGSAVFWTTAGSRPSPGARAIGAFCMASSLSVLYAVATPPFQAADEPNHFVGFALFAGRPELAAQAADWARLMHFERIQFHPAERFRPSDIGHPGLEWNDGTVPEMEIRGGGVRVLWKPVAALTRTWPAPRVLMAMRCFNALLFGLGVAGFVWVTVRVVALPSPHLLAWPLLFIPTLPFFGMHFSNHAPLLVAYSALGLGVLLMVLDTARPTLTGLLIGAGFTTAITLSRSALPLGALIAPLLLGRMLLGGRPRGMRSALGFWLGLAAPVVIGGLFLDLAYVEAQAQLAQRPLPSPLVRAALLVVRHPWVLLLLAAGMAAIEVGLSTLVARAGEAARTVARRTVAFLAACAAIAVGSVMISSVWFHYPMLPVVNRADPLQPGAYMLSAVLAAVTSPRLRFHDHLTSVSFWGGFGWIDTLPAAWMIGILAGASGAALIVLLLRAAREHAVRRVAWLMVAFTGVLVSLACYAFSVISVTPADLHGRYLLGLYLAALLICWSPLADLDLTRPGRRRSLAVVAGAVSIAAIHAYCVCLILRRYF